MLDVSGECSGFIAMLLVWFEVTPDTELMPGNQE